MNKDENWSLFIYKTSLGCLRSFCTKYFTHTLGPQFCPIGLVAQISGMLNSCTFYKTSSYFYNHQSFWRTPSKIFLSQLDDKLLPSNWAQVVNFFPALFLSSLFISSLQDESVLAVPGRTNITCPSWRARYCRAPLLVLLKRLCLCSS